MRLNHCVEQRSAEGAHAHAKVGNDHGADEEPRNASHGGKSAANDEDDDGDASQKKISSDGVVVETCG